MKTLQEAVEERRKVYQQICEDESSAFKRLTIAKEIAYNKERLDKLSDIELTIKNCNERLNVSQGGRDKLYDLAHWVLTHTPLPRFRMEKIMRKIENRTMNKEEYLGLLNAKIPFLVSDARKYFFDKKFSFSEVCIGDAFFAEYLGDKLFSEQKSL